MWIEAIHGTARCAAIPGHATGGWGRGLLVQADGLHFYNRRGEDTSRWLALLEQYFLLMGPWLSHGTGNRVAWTGGSGLA